MKVLIASMIAGAILAGVAGCQTDRQYDGVSRFADENVGFDAYYGPGSPPRDFGESRQS